MKQETFSKLTKALQKELSTAEKRRDEERGYDNHKRHTYFVGKIAGLEAALRIVRTVYNE